MNDNKPKIAIIGGSGFYEFLENPKEVEIEKIQNIFDNKI